MPFTEWARDQMAAIWAGTMDVALGTVDGPTYEPAEPVVAEFRAEGGMVTNASEIVFPRSAINELSLTHWHITAPGGAVASDKLERPIILRAGERATFPPGALRMEVL